MAYADPNTIHNPATGQIIPAAWGDVVRDDLEFLVDPPACSVSGSDTLTSGTAKLIAMTAENYDNDAMHSTVTDTTRITAQTAGRYLIYASADFASNITGHRSLQIRRGGSLINPPVTKQAVQTGSTVTGVVIARSLIMSAGQYVELEAFQNSGGNLAITVREFAAYFLTR